MGLLTRIRTKTRTGRRGRSRGFTSRSRSASGGGGGRGRGSNSSSTTSSGNNRYPKRQVELQEGWRSRKKVHRSGGRSGIIRPAPLLPLPTVIVGYRMGVSENQASQYGC